MKALRQVLAQALAFAWAEWLRQLTAPVWAALLLLWTVVSAVLLHLILGYAAGTELPPGESVMSTYFRSGNTVLALMMVVFVPLLCLDAIAGRRESGRLEHLLVAGLRPAALVLGCFLATTASLLVLLVPPLLIHLVLLPAGASDGGHLIGGVLALLLTSAGLASLGIACSAWAPGRTAAALAAAALGLLWWMGDHLPGGGLDERGLSLGRTIRNWAGGLVDWRGVVAFSAVIGIGLLLARAGVLARHDRLPRALAVPAWLLALVALGGPLQRCDGGLLIGGSEHRLATATTAAFADLVARGPVTAHLVATPAMRDDRIDGPLHEALRSALEQLGGQGLDWSGIDPDLAAPRLADLRQRLAIPAESLRHPLLVLEHLDRHVVLGLDDLAVVEEGDRGLRLAALRCDDRLRVAAGELGGELPRIAWCGDLGDRPREAGQPGDRDRAISSLLRCWAAAGSRAVACPSTALAGQAWDLIVLPGPAGDPAPERLAAIAERLALGDTVLVLLDGARRAQPGLDRFLADRGIFIGPGHIHGHPVLDGTASVSVHPAPGAGPGALVAQLHEHIQARACQPLRLGEAGIPGWVGQAWLPVPAPLWLAVGQGPAAPLAQGRHLVVEARHSKGGRLVVAGIDPLANGAIDLAGNRLYARGLFQWLCRPEQAVAAASETGARRRLRIAPGTAGTLRWSLGILLPLLAIALGTGTWWWRRRA